jgi:hypothetical protein
MTNPRTRPSQPRPPLEDPRVGIRTKLSALWVVVMFLYVYVDIFTFFKPGTIDDILIGRVWTFDITQGWALGALVLMTVPALMVVLSLTLPATAARWTNVAVASLYVLVSVGNAVGESWLYLWLGAAVEAAVLLIVVRSAWTWPRRLERPTDAKDGRSAVAPLTVQLPRTSSV